MSLHFFHFAYSSSLSLVEGALKVPSTKLNLDFAFKDMTMALVADDYGNTGAMVAPKVLNFFFIL